MSLKVYFKKSGENFIECIAGEENDNLEIVGTLKHYFYKGEYKGTSYTPRDTKVSSFHMRDNELESFITRLAPDIETMVQVGDQLQWGYEQPLIYVALDYPANDNPKEKN